MYKIETGINDSLFDVVFLAVGKVDVLDQRARIGPRKNHTNFADHTVEDILSLLTELIGVNRQLIHIAMGDELSGFLSSLTIIEVSLSPDAFFAIMQDRIPNDVARFIVLMVPN